MTAYRIWGPEQTDSPFVEFGAKNIDGREFLFRLEWMERYEFWTLEMLSARREPLILGIRVGAGRDLLFPYASDRFPPGQLYCHDTRNEFANPGRFDWRDRHILVYQDPFPPPPAPNYRFIPQAA